MIPLLSRTAVRALDADAVARLGLPSVVLMENAGRGAFEVLRARYPQRLHAVTLLGGSGQNGGDAWVIARHLALLGHAPRCVLIGERAKVRGDAQINLDVLERIGVHVAEVTAWPAPALDAALSGAQLIVDGLFGTGLDRPISGLYAQVIARINADSAPCVALDIPSGIDADTGQVLGTAVRAACTVTFAAHKPGLHQHPGAAHAGEIELASIGVPTPGHAGGVGTPVATEHSVLEASDVAASLPLRAADTHKGRGGHVLVIAGAPGRTGACLLAGYAAMRAGAGLVTLCPRAGARVLLDAKVVELMTADLPEDLEAAEAHVLELMHGKHAAVIGPGLGTDPEGLALARRLSLALTAPCVLDADALTAWAGAAEQLRSAGGPRVLTPHPAEAARLLGATTERVQDDRYASARRLAELTRAVVVLKGARTLIAHPDGAMHVCPLDVPALAVAGTGDVLAGTVSALLGQGQLDAMTAASSAVYLHGLAGQLAARSDRGLFAHEVADALPAALEACRA
jgi:hydroxyethylthiazole kinase-like uncharacterized protein yjeF